MRREGRANVYTPRVRQRRVVKEVVEDFLERMFDGEALPLVQHLIRERGLSDQEIDDLQQTLNQLKERKR